MILFTVQILTILLKEKLTAINFYKKNAMFLQRRHRKKLNNIILCRIIIIINSLNKGYI